MATWLNLSSTPLNIRVVLEYNALEDPARSECPSSNAVPVFIRRELGRTNTEYNSENPQFGVNRNSRACVHGKPVLHFSVCSGGTELVDGGGAPTLRSISPSPWPQNVAGFATDVVASIDSEEPAFIPPSFRFYVPRDLRGAEVRVILELCDERFSDSVGHVISTVVGRAVLHLADIVLTEGGGASIECLSPENPFPPCTLHSGVFDGELAISSESPVSFTYDTTGTVESPGGMEASIGSSSRAPAFIMARCRVEVAPPLSARVQQVCP